MPKNFDIIFGNYYFKKAKYDILYPWKLGDVFIYMLTVFGDESHDGQEERIFAVAGIMGTAEEWERIEPIWNDRLERHPWKIKLKNLSFHAADCEANPARGDFKGIPHETNRKLYKDLTQQLIEANLLGYGTAMNLKIYKESFPDYRKNFAYQLCFQRVIKHFAGIAYISKPKQKVHFVFDNNTENNFSAGLLYEHLFNLPGWEYAAQLILPLSFLGREDSIGIQVADLVAREAMKYYDNLFLGENGHNVRKSMQELKKTGKYTFDSFNKDTIEAYKKQSETEEWKQSFEIFKQGYKQWLLQKELTDNTTNINIKGGPKM